MPYTTTTPALVTSKIDIGAGKWYFAPAGTVTSTYAPAGAAGAFTLGSAATNVPGNAAWLPAGTTRGGSTITIEKTVQELFVEEYGTAALTPSDKLNVSFQMDITNDNISNYAMAMNSPDTAWSGTPSATVVAKYVPGLSSADVTRQWLFVNTDADSVYVFYAAKQDGAVTFNRKRLDYVSLSLNFKVLQPDSAVAADPFARYVIGAQYVATTGSE